MLATTKYLKKKKFLCKLNVVILLIILEQKRSKQKKIRQILNLQAHRGQIFKTYQYWKKPFFSCRLKY